MFTLEKLEELCSLLPYPPKSKGPIEIDAVMPEYMVLNLANSLYARGLMFLEGEEKVIGSNIMKIILPTHIIYLTHGNHIEFKLRENESIHSRE